MGECSRRLWLVLGLGSLVMLGCGAPLRYGSFLEGQDALQASVATDAVEKINALYPPERHSIQILHESRDPFGKRLIHGLRGSGYLVLESQEQAATGYHGLSYVLDRVEGTDMLRVQLQVDDHALSRAYVQRPDGLFPVGAWSSVGGGGS